MRKGTGGAANGKPAPRQLADARQAAILLLRRIAVRDNDRDKPTTRAQFTVTDAEASLESTTALARILRRRVNMVSGRGLVLLQCWGNLCRCSHQRG
jgi:hypothetical protein